MKLKKILDAHQKFSNKNSLSDNLGDGYLLAHNPVYRSIRIASLEAGLHFSSKRFHDYEVLPLTQLPKILAEKIIPYVPNVNALQEIEKAMPGVFQIVEVPPLRANYVLHESAHGIARLIRVLHLGNPQGKSLIAQRELALAIMLEESFANAAESMLSAFVGSEIHEEFLKKNTYILEDANSRNKIKTALKFIGLGATFRLILLSFLYSNFLKLKLTDSEFNRVLTIALLNDPEVRLNLNIKETRLLRDVFLGGFDLDPLFTIRTNGFCLRLMGITSKLPKLFDYDFLACFEKDPRYQFCLNAMTEVFACKKD